MKLIIDIPEEEYKEVLKDTYSGTPFENKIFTAISNGVPLDKIRAEISDYKDDKLIHAERNEMIDIVLTIIDKYREDGE